MAGSSLLLLLDDIAAVLDDVATMTKVAAGKTAGVLGDDLAVNAEKVTGVRSERELPVYVPTPTPDADSGGKSRCQIPGERSGGLTMPPASPADGVLPVRK